MPIKKQIKKDKDQVNDAEPVKDAVVPDLDQERVTEVAPLDIATQPTAEEAAAKGIPSVFPKSGPENLGNNYSYTAGVRNSNGYNQRNNGSMNNNRRMMKPMNGNDTSRLPQRNNYNNRSGSTYQDRYASANTDASTYTGDVIAIKGMLEILPDYGVIRQDTHPYDNPELPKDIYISQSQIRRFNLRSCDFITGFARPPKEGERYLSLLKVDTVEKMDPEEARKRPHFSKLTPIFPNKWIRLETATEIISTRLIDLVAPIGKGQRAMVVAPPKAGKTWLLKDIANGITSNYPEVALMVALIGERPEEVTHFSRSVKGEVFASNFDEKAEDQTRIAEICLERAKRMAEQGKDVVILMDSLTRLARAYNMVAPPSGRTLTGGFDPAALYPAKHFFGAARNFEEGGSLTIIATALVDTGSRMDDVIFEEFKGTGNMELRLDRALAERRIYPSVDIKASGTRHEEYLVDKAELEKIFRLRRMIDLLDARDTTDLVIERLKKSKNNKEFLDNLHKVQ